MFSHKLNCTQRKWTVSFPGWHRKCSDVYLLAPMQDKQDAQLSQRDRAEGYISFGRTWKTGTGRQYFTDIIGLSSTTVT